MLSEMEDEKNAPRHKMSFLLSPFLCSLDRLHVQNIGSIAHRIWNDMHK